MQGITYASDFDGRTGDERIQRAIDEAADQPGHGTVFVGTNETANGVWKLTKSIELPSHTTLLLSGAELYLADGADDNLLRNRDLESGNEDVHVLGIGGAHLHGNAINQERESDRLYTTYGVHFCNVDGLSMAGFTIGPTHAWGITLEAVQNAQVSDLRFAQDGSTANQDGIHILGPSERINIVGLTGSFGDDVVAVDAASGDSGLGYGSGGDVRGVVVANVTARNAAISGLLRTISERGRRVDGVHASNLQFTGDAGGGDGVIKIGWFGWGVDKQPRPEEHRNITLENVWVREWDGPYTIIKSPVENLTLSRLQGRHTGPLLYNLENDIDGCRIEECRTTLVGEPPETMFTDLVESISSGEASVLNDAYADRLQGTVVDDGHLATITVANAVVRDLQIQNSTFAVDIDDASPPSPIAVRVFESASVENTAIESVTIREYETGIKIDEGANVSLLRIDGIVQDDVAVPWAIGDTEPVASGNTPPYRRLDETLLFDSGERKTVELPAATERGVKVIPIRESDNDHGYRVESLWYDTNEDAMKVRIRETEQKGGGRARIIV